MVLINICNVSLNPLVCAGHHPRLLGEMGWTLFHRVCKLQSGEKKCKNNKSLVLKKAVRCTLQLCSRSSDCDHVVLLRCLHFLNQLLPSFLDVSLLNTGLDQRCQFLFYFEGPELEPGFNIITTVHGFATAFISVHSMISNGCTAHWKEWWMLNRLIRFLLIQMDWIIIKINSDNIIMEKSVNTAKPLAQWCILQISELWNLASQERKKKKKKTLLPLAWK